MRIERRFTRKGQSPYEGITFVKRSSKMENPYGSTVFKLDKIDVPEQWTQLATDIMVSKYFRKAGVPQTDANGQPLRDETESRHRAGESDARQVIHRLAGCWTHWGEKHGYFDTAEDAQAFYDELCLHAAAPDAAPNSPQWFNTGLHFAYGITGPAQGHYYCDPRERRDGQSEGRLSHPQPHACFIQSVNDDLVNAGGIMDLWTREARLFKYGSGTGSNFSKLRGENEAALRRREVVGADELPEDRRPRRRRDQVRRHDAPRRQDGLPRS